MGTDPYLHVHEHTKHVGRKGRGLFKMLVPGFDHKPPTECQVRPDPLQVYRLSKRCLESLSFENICPKLLTETLPLLEETQFDTGEFLLFPPLQAPFAPVLLVSTDTITF